MTEEFKKLFDQCEAIEKAKSLAAGLGYLQGYYGNLDYNITDCEEEYIHRINTLVGKDWPEEVKKVHEESYHEGYMDS